MRWHGREDDAMSVAAIPASLREHGGGELDRASNQSLSSTANEGRGTRSLQEEFFPAADKTRSESSSQEARLETL